MGYLTTLDDAVRSSGLRTVLVAGWATRGHGPMSSVDGIIVHHTGTSASAPGNYPTLRVVRDGRSGLAGPLSQLGLGRDGTVYVIAAGRCSHAGRTYYTWQQNSRAIGIEAEGTGTSPLTALQLKAYPALVAALAEFYDVPTAHVASHKEAAYPHYRKTDPYGIDMTAFRAKVADARRVGPATTVTVPPRDPTYGHRGIPAALTEDGVWGARSLDAFMWYVHGDRLTGMTRDNVRDVQLWLGRDRDGLFSSDDLEALQRKVGATVDGVWPNRVGAKSNTTLAIQRYLNRRISDARAAA